MAIRNTEGTYSDFAIECRSIEGLTVNSGKVSAKLEGVNLHHVFEQLTAEQIIQLIPDQATLDLIYSMLCVSEAA
jgi:hypothetical protein